MPTDTTSAAMTLPHDSRGESASAPPRSLLARDSMLYAVLVLLVLAVWRASGQGWAPPGSDRAYWLGVAGGVAMLLLLAYPLRKHVRALHGWGKVKWWLVAHMALGIGGPVMILLHANFRVGSLNAAVALYSMVVVAASGVVGRFLKLRVHRGLQGEECNLQQLQARAGLAQDAARSRLAFAPGVEARLRAFEARERASCGWPARARQVLLLPSQQAWTYLRCAVELRKVLDRLAVRRGWSALDRARYEKQFRRLVWRYLTAVTRVAQYTAFERAFALWHVAHVPFVYLLIGSAVVHVVAVHAY